MPSAQTRSHASPKRGVPQDEPVAPATPPRVGRHPVYPLAADCRVRPPLSAVAQWRTWDIQAIGRSPKTFPWIIAHRGASAVAPEGTRAAIRCAAQARADMVELDVQMTFDGELIIFHDERLERTTNGRGHIGRTPYSKLAQLDAGCWFHPRFKKQRILLLSQALRYVPSWMGINLELKRTSKRKALLNRILQIIASASLKKRLLLSSFDPALLEGLQGTGLALALICRHYPDSSLRQAVRLRCKAWHPFHSLLNPTRIEKAHTIGLRVHAWTIDEPKQARQLLRWGVDGFFTNDPKRLRDQCLCL